MWGKQYHKPQKKLGMVNIPPTKMVMTGGCRKWHCFTLLGGQEENEALQLRQPLATLEMVMVSIWIQCHIIYM